MVPRAGLDGRKISSPPGFDPGPTELPGPLTNSITQHKHTLPLARLLKPVHVNVLYKNCVYSCLPEDELMRFQTCRRRQKLKNLN